MEQKMNYIYHDFFVNDSTNMVGYNGAATHAILIDNHWGNANAGTNGYALIGGIGTGNTSNKRISYSGMHDETISIKSRSRSYWWSNAV